MVGGKISLDYGLNAACYGLSLCFACLGLASQGSDETRPY